MLKLLENLFIFNGIDFSNINNKYGITEKINVTEYCDGETVLTSENGQVGVFLVLEGNGYIYSVSKNHKAPLRYLSEGDTFGAASLYGTPTSHRTKVIAQEHMKTAILTIELITELIENESEIALNYIRFLSDRVSFLNRKIAAFSAGSAEEKFALYLLSLPYENEILQLSESYTNIAKTLDIGRASLYRAIENFENSGIISRSGKSILITDRNKLLQMIN